MMAIRRATYGLLLVLGAVLIGQSCIQKRKPIPPVARISTVENNLHGATWTDDYFWLRERGKPQVMDYLTAENAYAEAVMGHTADLREELYRQMRGRIKEEDYTVPVKDGDYYYYDRTEEGKQYSIQCRKKGKLEATEEVILDENELAAGLDYMEIGQLAVSPNHRLLAYSVDTNGSEIYTIYVKDLKSGELLADRVPRAYYPLVWGNDNKTLFYTVLDDALRPYQLYRHKLGTDYLNDELVYTENDQAFELGIAKTRSKKYILLTLESNTTTEVHYLRADRLQEQFKVLHPRQPQMEYYVSHRDKQFYILTNDGAPNFKLMRVSVKKPSKRNWVEILPHRDSVKLEGFDLFKDYLVVYKRVNGLKQIGVTELKSGKSHEIEFPEPTYHLWPEENREFDSRLLRFTYTSLVTPTTVYDYDMKERTRELKKRKEVLGGYDPEQYQSERVFAPAADGSMIPISLVYRKGLKRDGTNPVYLNGYGAYGISSNTYFSSNRLSLLDKGFVYAIAHVRGGGEMGRYWYDQGKLLNKKNTFTDFIACAEFLIAEQYTSPEKLAAGSGSAGGLLIGAIANMRPDLFEVLVADVPFVDLINTMLDPSIPLTVIEYEEWGNPNEKEYFDYMMSYSPYDNVIAQEYPNMLITAGLNDPRV
ncbi:MAG: S9 family peptidase, partial [candidate division Zixibacteria bacterium]|nr:S9 family peptidase [candidate division Zixibacteria bacterium]